MVIDNLSYKRRIINYNLPILSVLIAQTRTKNNNKLMYSDDRFGGGRLP